MCGGRFSGSHGLIKTPNHPANYASNGECEWFLEAPTGHYLKLTFQNFRLEGGVNCSNDFVEVRDINATGERQLILVMDL